MCCCAGARMVGSFGGSGRSVSSWQVATLGSARARAFPSVAQRAALDRLPWRPANDVSSNVTEVLVARLRQKLAAAGGGVEIRTVRRTGYRVQTTTATEAGA